VRVLWFTSVMPAAVAKRLGTTRSPGPASWVESLLQAVSSRETLDLAIASPSPTATLHFTEDRVTYYAMPVAEPGSRLGRAVSGWRHSITPPNTEEACRDVIEHFKPDVIHVQGTENPFGLIGPDAGAPVVVSLQGLLTMVERYLFCGQTAQETVRLAFRREFVLGRGGIHGYWRGVKMAARERNTLRLNRRFIGRTEWDRAVLWAVNPTATYYHCDEVLRPPFYEAKWRPRSPESRTIFCTSSAVPLKGADCLIEALGLLRAAGYSDVRLRIAGISPTGPGSEFFTTRARRHGVAQCIDWLGRLDAEQLVGELLTAALFAYPSHIDNSPNALCEALLVGVPTVASYVGGVPSLLGEGREGLLYPDGDPYALAGKIRYLLDNGSFAAEAGQRARQRALRRHDPDAIVTRLVSIYRDLQS